MALIILPVALGPQNGQEPRGKRRKLEELENARAVEITPTHLIPADYEKHREFFLRSYREHGWTMEQTISEWTIYQETLYRPNRQKS
jgi:hypothetical protein